MFEFGVCHSAWVTNKIHGLNKIKGVKKEKISYMSYKDETCPLKQVSQ